MAPIMAAMARAFTRAEEREVKEDKGCNMKETEARDGASSREPHRP
ncbi:hypothetical protein GCM10023165_13720 [Variovorax defluvii]|uniref:Uncharacterized protein n=1 Tax=Variovorax defluvii TaxID=913761 RepID=A0ABP8H9W2_9BURK